MNLHGEIMNLPLGAGAPETRSSESYIAYRNGHRDARHAAAELAIRAEIAIEELEAKLVMADEIIAKLERDRQLIPADWRVTVGNLVEHIESNTCLHESTHRGGVIWEICDDCGAQWADDRGGKPDLKYPDCVEKARELLAMKHAVEPPATQEETGLPMVDAATDLAADALLAAMRSGFLKAMQGAVDDGVNEMVGAILAVIKSNATGSIYVHAEYGSAW